MCGRGGSWRCVFFLGVFGRAKRSVLGAAWLRGPDSEQQETAVWRRRSLDLNGSTKWCYNACGGEEKDQQMIPFNIIYTIGYSIYIYISMPDTTFDDTISLYNLIII